MSKKKLLVCMPDFPFPARKNGISIRYFPILEHAAKTFDIHLVVIANGQVGLEEIAEAKKFCPKVSVYTRQPQHVSSITKLKVRLKSFFPVGIPYEQIHFDEKEVAAFIASETNGTVYDVALCVLLTFQHIILKYVRAKRYTLDVIDSPYSTSMRKSKDSMLKAYDTLMVKIWERRTINSVDYTCYISPLDRELGAGKNSNEHKIGIIPNGLYLTDYSEDKINYGFKTIAYLGHMAYPPNVRAALRLYSIFQSSRSNLVDTKLLIIGRDPAPEISQLSGDTEVIVTGTVDNIWTYVNSADLFVFPMEIGSGQQNKLLEAMQCGIPVISTALGNSGVGATNGTEIIIADSDAEIADKISLLMNDDVLRKKIGEGGRRFVQNKYEWNPILNKIDRTLLSTIE